MGLPVAPEEAIVTAPVYCCPAVRPVPLTVTVTAPGALPLVGLTLSQLPPVAVDALAVNGRPEGDVVTLMVCVFGAGPPAICEKLSVVLGVTEIEPAVTTTVT